MRRFILMTALWLVALVAISCGEPWPAAPATATMFPTIPPPTDTATPTDTPLLTDTPVPLPQPTPTPEPPVFIWPTRTVRWITGTFGEQRGFDPADGHHGIDIVPANVIEEPILAIHAGCVTAASDYDGYGNRVVLDHGSGVQSLYAHLESFAVAVGDCVVQGQTLGILDSTGWSTGPHLHFEMRVDGVRIDPLQHLPGLGGDSLPIQMPPNTDYHLPDDW